MDGNQAELFLAAGKELLITQLDGNSSLISENEENDRKDSPANNIQVQIGHRPRHEINTSPRKCSRKTNHRDEGLVVALNLPVVTLYNMRSKWSKINNLADDINMRGTDLCFLTEIWEKQENKKHQRAIEEMMEMKVFFLIFITTPEGQVRVQFLRILISFQSGTESID